ncbi:MAG: hypothetical protein WKF50_07520 [Nocardioides sp.]
MRFTENELTLAVTAAAKTVLAARKDVRRRRQDVDEAWEALTRYQRYQLLDGVGGQILSVLVALPDVEVESGTRPTFTDQQIRETVESVVGDGLGRVRRAVTLAARVALVTSALAGLPPRQDPDALTVPDHL